MADTVTIPADIDASAELLRVLGHETRLRLLLLLVAGEQAVGELDVVSGIGQPALSQQLAVLRKAGLVATRRAAKQVYYRVDPEALQPVRAILTQLAGASLTVAPARPEPPAQNGNDTSRQTASSAAGFARML
jgi:DNA-binding transcriptional ArsR family regulator